MDSSIEGRIEKLLRTDRQPVDPGWIHRPVQFDNFGKNVNSGGINALRRVIHLEQERRDHLVQWLHGFLNLIKDEDGVLERLDQYFASTLRCNLQLDNVDEAGHKMLILETRALLERLPSVMPFLPKLHLRGIPAAFFSAQLDSSSREWSDLTVATTINTNNIRQALCFVAARDIPGNIHVGISHSWDDFVNCHAELMELCSELESEASQGDAWKCCLARAFFWSSWRRALLLQFHAGLQGSLVRQILVEFLTLNDSTEIRSMMIAPGVSAGSHLSRISSEAKSPHMCSWAMNLLQSHQLAPGMDFRDFRQVYQRAFEAVRPRCSKETSLPCDGKHPSHCQRFQGVVLVDQSQHDISCPGSCSRLVWDRDSYLKIEGSRAVAACEETSKLQLKFCQSSSSTLAVSHVWLHGQGGRPETGMNSCLHRRYCDLATRLGCNSYWMDTPCIPEDHILRKEAIDGINEVFRTAKHTLVCDFDLMQIEMGSASLKQKEELLAALLVCDWSVRAWTFLEAVRGSRSIILLCKNNVTVSIDSITHDIFRESSLAFSNLLLFVTYLFSSNTLNLEEYVLAMEDAGTLLSYRPASRPGDEFVIWSLLLNNAVTMSAKEFWKGQRRVRTGFLVSSATRLKQAGLSWAPRTPYAAGDPKIERFYRAFSGRQTTEANISNNGLFGQWYNHEFETEILRTNISALIPSRSPKSQLEIIKKRFLRRYRFGMLLQPALDIRSTPQIVQYAGDCNGTLVVVCGSNKTTPYVAEKAYTIRASLRVPDALRTKTEKKRYGWKWLGVYEWAVEEDLPKLELGWVMIE